MYNNFHDVYAQLMIEESELVELKTRRPPGLAVGQSLVVFGTPPSRPSKSPLSDFLCQ